VSNDHFGKSAWRRRLLSQRSGSPPPGRSASDAARRLPPDLAWAPGLEGVLPSAGEWAAAYLSLAAEPATTGLLRLLAAREIRVLAPAAGPTRRELAWAEVKPATCALPAAPAGRLAQPDGPALAPAALERCRLILAPALAVDRSGTRLGRGGGWYDRALAHAAGGALVLGVCFPWELLPAQTLPREVHDVPVAGALTSQGVVLF
jgi:5-formyltetrahydrofolate cyclo-ligase